MLSDANRAELHFRNARISGIVTTVGGNIIEFKDEAERMGLSDREAKRLQMALGLNTRYVAGDSETTVDYCHASARHLLLSLGLSPGDVQGLILVTQSPDYSAPSSAIALQHALGMPVTSMAFDMRLGCSGFVYGLACASSLVESGLSRILLCVGDIASRLVDPKDHSIAPLMGDAGAAILIERRPSESFFQLYSDGSGSRALIIPNSGLRHVPEDVGLPSLMQMNGASVFNFTLQRVPMMISEILAYAGTSSADIDYFLLHQPNKYILRTLQKRLQVTESRLPMATQGVYGNQNSASIPGTINGFLVDRFNSTKLTSVLAGFGIGLSWASAIVTTENIYAPPPFVGL